MYFEKNHIKLLEVVNSNQELSKFDTEIIQPLSILNPIQITYNESPNILNKIIGGKPLTTTKSEEIHEYYTKKITNILESLLNNQEMKENEIMQTLDILSNPNGLESFNSAIQKINHNIPINKKENIVFFSLFINCFLNSDLIRY